MDATAHILFVEDDPEIRGLVADFLGANGYRVSVARDGREMDRILHVSRIDLLILDSMLPGEDGISLCRRVRAEGSMPVIMLTARGSEIERVVGLEMAADDYLPKPFSTHELLARIRAVLRRTQALAATPSAGRPSSLAFGGWILNLASRRLQSADGTRVPADGRRVRAAGCVQRAPEPRADARPAARPHARPGTGRVRSQRRHPGEPPAAQD